MDKLITVEAVLEHGDRVALPTGNMFTIYRIVHNVLNGETTFEYEGLATLTGAHQTFRRAHSAGVSGE